MKTNIEFTVIGKPIEIAEEFKYLGRVVTKHDKDEPAVTSRDKKPGASDGEVSIEELFDS
jgi:hypothetical protein